MSTKDEARAPFRVLIADDSWHYAGALEAALTREQDIEVVHVSYSAEELVKALDGSEVDADVVLLDLDLPEMGGVAACRVLQDRHPGVAVVVVTASADAELARECMALGARAYIVKYDHHDPQRIAEAVRHAAQGDLFFDRQVSQLLLTLASHVPDPAGDAGLTPREVELIPLIAEGLQNKEIAVRVGVSEQTVRNHLSNTYRKLGAHNRTQMLAEARRRGILR